MLANMKLGNDNDAGSTKISPVPPVSSTTVNTAHKTNTSNVVRSDRAEPAPINSTEQRTPILNGEQECYIFTIISSHIIDIFIYFVILIIFEYNIRH